MRANRRSEARVSGELGSYFLAQLLRRMNSAAPSAVRTAQELILIWCWPPCRGLCIIFSRGVLLYFGLFFLQRTVADLPRENHPFSTIFGTCLMNLNAAFARALSGSTGLIIASPLYTRRQAGSSIIWRTAFIFVPLGL